MDLHHLMKSLQKKKNIKWDRQNTAHKDNHFNVKMKLLTHNARFLRRLELLFDSHQAKWWQQAKHIKPLHIQPRRYSPNYGIYQLLQLFSSREYHIALYFYILFLISKAIKVQKMTIQFTCCTYQWTLKNPLAHMLVYKCMSF